MGEVAGRNIIVLSDGTGNSAGKLFKTNVWRLYEALDLSNASQAAFYDDGVGNSSIRPVAILGGVFGWGLKRNVLALYMFLCRNYRPGDRIFGFGFSRGAFTIRILMNFILAHGLVRDPISNDDLRRKSLYLYRQFRAQRTPRFGLYTIGRLIRDLWFAVVDFLLRRPGLADLETTTVEEIEFLGVWDTVDAYGIPVEELRRGIDRWIWQLSLNDKKLHPRIRKACHALAIDDMRTMFHPLLWDEAEAEHVDHTDDERLTQVWFAGVHANVGGGYPDDALSYVPLRWMMLEAAKKRLRFKTIPIEAMDAKRSPYGRIHDSRAGLAALYRYGPRRLDPPSDRQGARIPEPKVHETVFWRVAMGTDDYAPLTLPGNLRVVTDARSKLPQSPDESATDKTPNILAFDRYHEAVVGGGDLSGAPAGAGASGEERERAIADFRGLRLPGDADRELVWDTVWWRRVAYYACFGLIALLIAFPVLFVDHSWEYSADPITRAAGWIGDSMPKFAQPWVESFRIHQFRVSILAIGILSAFLWGRLIDRRIHDRSLATWSAVWLDRRQKWYKESIRRRYQMLFLLFGLIFAYIVFDEIKQTNTGFYVTYFNQFSSVRMFVKATEIAKPVAALIAIYVALLWFSIKFGKFTLGEQRGPALTLAFYMSRLFSGPVRVLSQGILPHVYALVLLMATPVVLSRVSFDFLNSLGATCKDPGSARDGEDDAYFTTNVPNDGAEFELTPNSRCQFAVIDKKSNVDEPGETPVVLKLRKGVTYEIHILSEEIDWYRENHGAPSIAVPWAPRWLANLMLEPFRRHLFAPWSAIIAKIDEKGDEEYALTSWSNTLTPRKDGTLIFLSNSPVIGIPGYYDLLAPPGWPGVKVMINVKARAE